MRNMLVSMFALWNSKKLLYPACFPIVHSEFLITNSSTNCAELLRFLAVSFHLPFASSCMNSFETLWPDCRVKDAQLFGRHLFIWSTICFWNWIKPIAG